MALSMSSLFVSVWLLLILSNVADYVLADKCASLDCQNGGICKVIENEPVCECSEEYAGYTCEAHKCDGITCQNNGTCYVVQGQARCKCPEDFRGEHCEYISEAMCSRYRKNCQETRGKCILAKEEIECKCHYSNLKYQQDVGCVVDSFTCHSLYPGCLQTGGLCTGYKDKFTICRCPKGTHYYQNERGCKVIDPCKDNPCANGGTCLVRGSNFTCNCKEPFTGATCNESVCGENQCSNRGKCLATNDNFQCVCEKPFTGKHCEIAPTELQNNTTFYVVIVLLLCLVAILVAYLIRSKIRLRRK